MTRATQPLALLTLLAFLLAVFPASIRADETTTEASGYEVGSGEGETEAWWGVAGAVVCGAGAGLIRFNPALGLNPYVLAATIAGCLLAVIDVAAA